MVARSVGVEEELLLIDPDSGRALALSSAVLRYAADESPAVDQALTSELMRQQIETNTQPCASLHELGSEVRRWRRAASEAAERRGARVAALATSPLAADPSISSSPRYQRIVEEFGLIAEEQLTCGCHVHVQIESESEGVAVLDRIRGWLPCLLALSANSPFWQAQDSGYASFRSRVWDRWPSAGPTEIFGSAETYHATTRAIGPTCAGHSGDPQACGVPPAGAARSMRARNCRRSHHHRAQRGNGATMQRHIYHTSGQLIDVVTHAVMR